MIRGAWFLLVCAIVAACGGQVGGDEQGAELGELGQEIGVPEYYGWTGPNNLRCDPNVANQLCYLPFPRGAIGTAPAYTRNEFIGDGYPALRDAFTPFGYNLDAARQVANQYIVDETPFAFTSGNLGSLDLYDVSWVRNPDLFTGNPDKNLPLPIHQVTRLMCAGSVQVNFEEPPVASALFLLRAHGDRGGQLGDRQLVVQPRPRAARRARRLSSGS